MFGMKNKEGAEMSFLEHLEVLRWHIIRSVLVISLLAVVAFIYIDFILDYIILAPKNPDFIVNKWFCELSAYLNTDALCINQKQLQIINIKMSGQFSTHIKISFLSGLVLGLPYFFYEIWKFVRPALYVKERKSISNGLIYGALLFFTGVAFGYFLIFPLSLHFLATYSISDQILNQINIGSYLGTFSSVVLAGGIIFELPVIMFYLSKAGIVTPKFLRKYRKHAIIVILIIGAIITPPDVFSQVMVSVPLWILFEVSIFLSAMVERKRNLKSNG